MNLQHHSAPTRCDRVTGVNALFAPQLARVGVALQLERLEAEARQRIIAESVARILAAHGVTP